MRNARGELSECAQLICPCSPFALLLLFRNVVGNAEHAGCLSINDDWGGVDNGIPHTSVSGDIARFIPLRLTRQHCGERGRAHCTIVFMRAFEKMMANDFLELIAR